jgi:hypothetical protein
MTQVATREASLVLALILMAGPSDCGPDDPDADCPRLTKTCARCVLSSNRSDCTAVASAGNGADCKAAVVTYKVTCTPCGELKASCARCPPYVKQSCEALANAGEPHACKANIQVYQQLGCN